MHAFALSGSAGQGAFLLLHIEIPLTPINKAEIKNKISLYLDIKIKKGRFDNNPAKIAPAPKVTKSAGNAQHSNVPMLVKRVIEGTIRFFLVIGFILNIFSYACG